MGDTYNTKDLPQFLRDCLKAIGYRRRKAIVKLYTGCDVYGTYWSGGSRNEYTTFDNQGGVVGHPMQGGDWGAMGMQFKPTKVEFTREQPLCIQAGTFCGKPGTAFIYIHPRFAQMIGLPVTYNFEGEWT